MPILLLLVLAAAGLGWFESRPCPFTQQEELVPAAPERSWQDRCKDRFDAARSEAAEDADFPDFARGELHTDDNPGGLGGVWYRIELPGGVRYGAGVSGPQDGEIPDVEWYSLNGAISPTDRFSLWKDEGGRSGFVAGVDPYSPRREAFQLVLRQAIDDCLEMEE